MNLQLGWDPVGTAHLVPCITPTPGRVAQRKGSGSWLRPYIWFIGYCGPDNTQVALQMAWTFSHRVAKFQGAWGVRPESYLRPSIGVRWHQLDTVHWSEQHKALPRCRQGGQTGMAGWDQKVLEDMTNQRYCSDHCETIQTSTPVASVHLLS